MDQAQKDRMAARSGDNAAGGNFPKYIVPLISFNGNTGEFKEVIINEKADNVENAITKPVKVVILKKKKVLGAFKTGKAWFTSEYSSPNDIISLFEVVAKKVVFVMSGTVAQVRENNQLLKMSEVLYVLYNGEVHKLEVKGSSLTPFWDFQKKLKDEDLHSFEVTTIINTIKQKNEEIGNTYYSMTFEQGAFEADADVVEAKQIEVDAALEKIDQYQAANQKSSPTVAATNTADKDYENLGGETINPDDIPF